MRFNRAKSEFYMMTAAGSTGKVSIISILLWVRKVKPTPTVLNAINQRLNSEIAKYPLRRVEVKTFTILNGNQSAIICFKDRCLNAKSLDLYLMPHLMEILLKTPLILKIIKSNN